MFSKILSVVMSYPDWFVGGTWAAGIVILSIKHFRAWFREDAEICATKAQGMEDMQNMMWSAFKMKRDQRIKILLTKVLFWPFNTVWSLGLWFAKCVFHPFLYVLDKARNDAMEQVGLQKSFRETPDNQGVFPMVQNSIKRTMELFEIERLGYIEPGTIRDGIISAIKESALRETDQGRIYDLHCQLGAMLDAYAAKPFVREGGAVTSVKARNLNKGCIRCRKCGMSVAAVAEHHC